MIQDYVFTFLAVFLLDIVYTYYLRAVHEDKAMLAGMWSVGCYILGSMAVINYTSDHMLILPAIAGAFLGTFAGMKLKKLKSQ